MLKSTSHTHLRVVTREGRFEVPRRYDQSTSGRTDSTGTRPPLSRSRAIAVDSAMRSFVDKALRRYPRVVPDRTAYAPCSSTERELRYVRSCSDICGTLPHSNSLTIPFVALPGSSPSQNGGMAEKDELRLTRQRRLRLLIQEIGVGGRIKLADAIGAEPNYISQLTSPRLKKPFGEETARKLERAANKPQYWLDTDDQAVWRERANEWPFSFDRSLWENLSATRRLEIESNLHAALLGHTAIEAASQQQKKRRPG
jgi:hypothetical protein